MCIVLFPKGYAGMKKITNIIALLALFCAAANAEEWTYAKFLKAMEDSGRKTSLPESDFDKMRQRREKTLVSIETYLKGKFGKADTSTVAAFGAVPREYFHYNYEKKESMAEQAYEDKAKPWSIGYGSALSDYLGQLYMTQLAAPKPADVVLEIGMGSGYQIALLSRMVKEAYSIEIIKPLGEGVDRIFAPLGYTNVHTRVGDGFFGWKEVQGGFDIIIVTCSARFVPPALLEQLKAGGRLIIPIGQPYKRGQALYVYQKDKDGKVSSKKDMGVYFIPMKGEMETNKK